MNQVRSADKEFIINLCRNTPLGFKMPELYVNESVAYIINERGEKEEVDLDAFHDVGIILNSSVVDKILLDEFIKEIKVLKANGVWSRDQLIALFNKTIPNFNHIEKNSFLDQKM